MNAIEPETHDETVSKEPEEEAPVDLDMILKNFESNVSGKEEIE